MFISKTSSSSSGWIVLNILIYFLSNNFIFLSQWMDLSYLYFLIYSIFSFKNSSKYHFSYIGHETRRKIKVLENLLIKTRKKVVNLICNSAYSQVWIRWKVKGKTDVPRIISFSYLRTYS